VTIKFSFKPSLKPDAFAKTTVITKLRFQTKVNLNNPVLNLLSVMHRDRRFFLNPSL